jgi:signal transduction histidine kinase/streptogramin lyase
LATQEGLYIFNPSRNETRQYRHHSREQQSLPGDEILNFLIDRSGNIWIATDKGVGKWARWEKPFRHFQHDTENPNSINKAEVTGIDTDSDGELWISSLNAGFCKFNPRTGIFTRYDPSTCSIKSPFAMEILAGRNGSIWIATNFVHGLNRFDPVTGKFMEFLHDPADTTSLSSDLVTTLFEDYEGRIWVGPAFNGLNLYEPRLERFRRFQHDPSNPATLSHNNVLSIYQDEALRLWIGTGHGLNRFDPDQNSFVRFVPDEISSQSSGSFELYDICEDLRRRLWLGTNLGLYLFERQAGRFERFAVLPGLADARIFGILEDGAGSLWLQATTAIAKFNPQTRKSRVYGRDDGWIQNGIHEQEWHHAVEKFSSGELVFGGSNGITIFHPDSIRDNPNVPPVHITGFNLFYEPVEISKNPAGRRAQGDSLLTRTLLSTEELILRHSERTFSFEFAALDYTQPEANQYAFKLEGFHDDWIYSGNEHTATFTNIPTGEYTFRVKGANNDGLWNEEGDAIRVSILPPWWKTKLAYATYVLLVCAALLAAWRFETNRMQMRNELRLREFEAKKMQEVDHLKSRFFANISHEFRTPLTLILGPLEGVIAKVKNQTAREDLRVMQRNANRLLRLINQLLDLSRLEDGRMQLQAGRGDLIAFLRGIVMSFASLADQKKIILKFESALELPDNVAHEIYFDRGKIEKIFYNLLSNAFKFTPEGGEVRVKLGFGENDGEKGGKGDAGNGREGDGEIMRSLSPTHPFPPSIEFGTKEFVKITISDTGIGIPADRLPYVFDRFYQVDDTHTREHEGTGIGLALTKELVERHYGTIAVRSEAGNGTEFIVRLPLGKEHLKAGEIVEDESRGQLSVISDQFSVFSRQTSVKRQRAREQDSITPSLQHSNTPTLQ